MKYTPQQELTARINRLKQNMAAIDYSWQLVVILDKINLFYFTGTIQNGVLFILRDSEPLFFVRKSYKRACAESKLKNIFQINSYNDILKTVKPRMNAVYIEKNFVPLAVFERFNKPFGFTEVRSADHAINITRAVKSVLELDVIKQAGHNHADVMENVVPDLLVEGISEAELGGQILQQMISHGHHGIIRMNGYNSELFVGHIGFGESPNYSSSYDGPSGLPGNSVAVPLLGSFDVKLKRNQLAYIDIGFGIDGYHTDKTSIYVLGKASALAHEYHEHCIEIQNRVAALLKPGNRPSDIYSEIMQSIDREFDKHFMGYGQNKVKFLGHGIGLVVDEYPVIAKGFETPLEENMVIAVEPKRGIKGEGMVGIENTFHVTSQGGVCLTGNKTAICEL